MNKLNDEIDVTSKGLYIKDYPHDIPSQIKKLIIECNAQYDP